jgi:hypothetical protein
MPPAGLGIPCLGPHRFHGAWIRSSIGMPRRFASLRALVIPGERMQPPRRSGLTTISLQFRPLIEAVVVAPEELARTFPVWLASALWLLTAAGPAAVQRTVSSSQFLP